MICSRIVFILINHKTRRMNRFSDCSHHNMNESKFISTHVIVSGRIILLLFRIQEQYYIRLLNSFRRKCEIILTKLLSCFYFKISLLLYDIIMLTWDHVHNIMCPHHNVDLIVQTPGNTMYNSA